MKEIQMTKKELIDSMKDYPDDAIVSIWCGLDCRDPGGTYGITKVDYDESFASRITFELECD